MKTPRILFAGLVAVTLAVAGASLRTWPVCAGIEPGSVEWYLFFCYLDPSPRT